MQRIILIIIGWLAVVLGTLGVVLPVLPTTPFILLAAWCFARSSPRFHAWLLYRSWFGSYLRFWQKHHAMPRGVKPRAILLILLTFAISLWHEYTLWMDGEEVMVRANQLEFAGDEMEEGMNYYDEESLSLCGVEDFLQVVAAYRNFVQQK